jgi:hypothetical protein
MMMTCAWHRLRRRKRMGEKIEGIVEGKKAIEKIRKKENKSDGV